MKREWKPGDVAMVTWYAHDRHDEIAVRSLDGLWHVVSSAAAIPDSMTSVAHPLVLIDPEDREQVERLRQVVRPDGLNGYSDVANWQQALREFADPKPPPICPATLVIGGERIECERDPDHVTDHRNDSIGQGVRWSA